MKVFHAPEDFLPAITQGWLWLGPASPFRFIYFPLRQKIYPEDKSRHLHLQVNEMKPSKPEKKPSEKGVRAWQDAKQRPC